VPQEPQLSVGPSRVPGADLMNQFRS
jgi:hypothetical protein